MIPGGLPTWLVHSSDRAGIAASRPDLHGQVRGLAKGLGQTLRDIHAIGPESIRGLPAEFGWSAVAAQIDRALEAGKVLPSSLPDPYCRYGVKQLHAIWVQGRPDAENLVLCHGKPLLSYFFFDGEDFVGTDHLESFIVADQHLDLAIMQREIHQILGAEAVFEFYEAYESDPDLVRIDHYLLGSFLR